MTKHRVTVWGEAITVEVHQVSKSVWIASGEYMGQRIDTKDRTASSAAKRWREAATYRGNG
jgi:hypothetical protein